MTRRANGRSHSRLSNGEISTVAVGAARTPSRPAPAPAHRRRKRRGGRARPSRTSASDVGPEARDPALQPGVLARDPAFGQCAARVTAHTVTSRRNSCLGRHRRRAILGRDHPLAEVVQPLKPLAAADRQLAGLHSASSMTLAGQLHIPPSLAPSKWRDPSGPRSRISASTCPARLGFSSITRPATGAPNTPPFAASTSASGRPSGRPRAPSTRTAGPRQQRSVTAVLRVGADARRERQPVAAIDRRDRVELHRPEASNRGLDSGVSSSACGRSTPARRSRGGAQRRPKSSGAGLAVRRQVLEQVGARQHARRPAAVGHDHRGAARR